MSLLSSEHSAFTPLPRTNMALGASSDLDLPHKRARSSPSPVLDVGSKSPEPILNYSSSPSPTSTMSTPGLRHRLNPQHRRVHHELQFGRHGEESHHSHRHYERRSPRSATHQSEQQRRDSHGDDNQEDDDIDVDDREEVDKPSSPCPSDCPSMEETGRDLDVVRSPAGHRSDNHSPNSPLGSPVSYSSPSPHSHYSLQHPYQHNPLRRHLHHHQSHTSPSLALPCSISPRVRSSPSPPSSPSSPENYKREKNQARSKDNNNSNSHSVSSTPNTHSTPTRAFSFSVEDILKPDKKKSSPPPLVQHGRSAVITSSPTVSPGSPRHSSLSPPDPTNFPQDLSRWPPVAILQTPQPAHLHPRHHSQTHSSVSIPSQLSPATAAAATSQPVAPSAAAAAAAAATAAAVSAAAAPPAGGLSSWFLTSRFPQTNSKSPLF